MDGCDQKIKLIFVKIVCGLVASKRAENWLESDAVTQYWSTETATFQARKQVTCLIFYSSEKMQN